MDKVRIYDKVGTMDRYTILIWDKERKVYAMFFSGLDPEGISGYCGDLVPGVLRSGVLGKRVDYSALSDKVRGFVDFLRKEMLS